MRSRSDTANQSQASLQAAPVGRVLRVLLGLVLIVYVTPVYFQVPARVAVRVLLLMLGLLGAYSLIHILISRRIIPLARSLGRLWRTGCSSRCMLQALRAYRSLATERVSSQRLPS